MSPRDWSKIEELFGQATALPPESRPAFLQDVCGTDHELRSQVKRLLEHDSGAGEDFLRTPPPDPHLDAILTDQRLDELLGRTVGSCKVKQVLAHGGMGTVYVADQLKPRREVALKVMHGGLWSESAQQRFQYESQVLARLHHPHIAQVYEAGTERLEDDRARSLPYFIMEYIPDARTITHHAEQCGLGTRERLQLFLPVCEAVHHGHQKGIIHRDLKPANILVDSSGHVKIIDFGVARSVDSDVAATTMHTAAGDLVGTLTYMSPEQSDADPLGIDTRTDVYALGVVLYELICGQLPCDVSGLSLTSAAQKIREQTPPRPSALNSKLRGDLETILLKTLEKDRDRRYESAAALGQDIRRYLNHEPIEARPPTSWTRGVRWVMRHPVVTTAAICLTIAAATLAGTGVAAWHYTARPHRIVRYRSGQPVDASADRYVDEARLYTFGGKVLCTWGGTTCGIAFASLVKCPTKFGGGKLALIGYGHAATDDVRGSLCAYDVHDGPDVPIWSRRIETEDILSKLRQERRFVGEDLCVQRGRVADVFPDPYHPGNEVVLTFNNQFSQRIIRVYDLGGNLLYEAWHEGSLSRLFHEFCC